jgi:hypothetical protein
LRLAVAAAGEASSRLGVLPGFWSISLHNLLHATILVTGLGFRLLDFSSQAPHCVFCAFQCCLLFGLQSSLFVSCLVPLLGVFPLFIYLVEPFYGMISCLNFEPAIKPRPISRSNKINWICTRKKNPKSFSKFYQKVTKFVEENHWFRETAHGRFTLGKHTTEL